MRRKEKGSYVDNGDIGLRFIFDFRNPILITHGDVDGLTAAALIIREFKLNKVEVPLFITQPFSLHHLLKDLKNKDIRGDFIIVDLAIGRKSMKLIPSGSVVIDHHPSTLEFIEVMKKRRIYNMLDVEVSASQLCGELVKQNKFNAYLARLGGVGDRRIEDKKMGKQAMILSAAMSLKHRDDGFRASIVAEFVNGRYVGEMKEVKARSIDAFKILDRVKRNGELLYDGDYIIAKFYADGFSRASVLSSKLSVASKKVAIVLTLMKGNSAQYLITGRSPEIDNEPMLNVRNLMSKMKSGGDGGGLVKAASCTIKKENLGKLIELLEKTDRQIKKERG